MLYGSYVIKIIILVKIYMHIIIIKNDVLYTSLGFMKNIKVSIIIILNKFEYLILSYDSLFIK